MTITHDIRKFLWKYGYDISRFIPTSHNMARKKHILEFYSIDTYLDIGANSGQSALELRDDFNYKGNILSFEPLSSAFCLLEKIRFLTLIGGCLSLQSVKRKRNVKFILQEIHSVAQYWTCTQITFDQHHHLSMSEEK
jgi:hypothetical protein